MRSNHLLVFLMSLILTSAVFAGQFDSTTTEPKFINPLPENQILEVSTNLDISPGVYNHGVQFTESRSLSMGTYVFNGPLIVPTGVILTFDQGGVVIQSSDLIIDGVMSCSNQVTNGGFGSGGNGQNGAGTGGGKGGTADGGAGGGGSYGSLGQDGASGSSNGGAKGITYGYTGLAPDSFIPSPSDIRTGSMGGGGAGGDDSGVIGGNGGAGGGSLFIETQGTLQLSGTINCNGGNGTPGDDGNDLDGAGGGGGGSGGGVLLYAGVLNFTGTINTLGGQGGPKGTGGIFGNDGGDGGDGGLGRIKLFYQDTIINNGTTNGETHVEQILIPSVSITTPQFGSVYLPISQIPLTIENSNGSYLYAWNSEPFTIVNDSYIPITPSSYGEHVLEIQVYSNTSVLIEKSFSIFVDGQAPQVQSFTSYLEYTESTLNNVLVFNASDAHPGLMNVTIDDTLIDSNLSWSNGTTSIAVDNLATGVHNVSVTLVDFVWNSVTIEMTVNVTAIATTIYSTIEGTQTVEITETVTANYTETIVANSTSVITSVVLTTDVDQQTNYTIVTSTQLETQTSFVDVTNTKSELGWNTLNVFLAIMFLSISMATVRRNLHKR